MFSSRTRSLLLLTLSALVCVVGVTTLSAQDSRATVNPTRSITDYAGVAPGNGNAPPRTGVIQRARSGSAQVITWPGFQMRPDGGSRFFLQVSASPEASASASEGRVEILLKNVRTHARNTRRPLVTEFFNTPVKSAKLHRRGRRDLAFVLQMRDNVTPNVTVQADGEFFFLFIDFPRGSWAPSPPTSGSAATTTRAPAPSAAPANSSASVRPAAAAAPAPAPAPRQIVREPTPTPTSGPRQMSREEMNALDNERPPGM